MLQINLEIIPLLAIVYLSNKFSIKLSEADAPTNKVNKVIVIII